MLNIANEGDAPAFKASLLRKLQYEADKRQICFPATACSIQEKFAYLVSSQPLGSVVLLIDEYDAAQIAFLQVPAKLEHAESIMRSFLAVIKNYGEYFRFVFITGITRYADSCMFTVGNTIKDISLIHRYSKLCGFTHAEIKQHFSAFLCSKAAAYFDCTETDVTPAMIDHIMNLMIKWYDGYCFDETGDSRVFSTWSVLKFFEDDGRLCKNFWYSSAGLPSILQKKLHDCNFNHILSSLTQNSFLVSVNDFQAPASLQSMNIYVLLFQCGYLTLKRGYITRDGIGFTVELWVPNLELKLLLQMVEMVEGKILYGDANEDNLFSLFSLTQLHTALQRHDAQLLAEVCSRVLQTCDYEHSPVTSEAALNYVLQVFFLLAGLNAIVNFHQAAGRADTILSYQDTTLIIEYKYSDSDQDAALNAKLNEAKEQLLSHSYGDTLGLRPILWQVALVYSKAQHKIARSQTVLLQKLTADTKTQAQT